MKSRVSHQSGSYVRLSLLTTTALLLLFTSVGFASAADITCDHCGEKITEGEWVEFDGQYFHPDHFLCANCGGDLKNGLIFVEEGLNYDSTCYFQLFVPRCAYCDLYIQGKCVEDDSMLYHEDCYENHIGPRCAICGKTLYGQYFVDLRGNTYHAEHESQYPTCEYCDCPLAPGTTGGGEKYSDGRHVCSLCLKSAVNDLEEAKKIMAETIEKLADYGIEINGKKIPLELTDRLQMQRESGFRIEDPSGYTSYKKQSLVPGVWSLKDFEVFVLHGMPRSEFVLTLAHELMHVWLFNNGESEMTEILKEGSCQYAGILAIADLQDQETKLVRQVAMENINPVYGEGLRQVDVYVREVGIEAWLQYLKDHKEPPW